MPEEVLTMVKIPLSDIEQSVRSKHSIPEVLVDVRLETDSLVLYFAAKAKISASDHYSQVSSVVRKKRKRRTRRKRNRMKTRGWEIVDRIVNSKGQRCAIYKPFVEALRQPMPLADQKILVAKILRSNRNRPQETSITYFLENTLEYLRKAQKAENLNSDSA